MDIAALQAAENAVAKIMKDYKPVADLAAALAKVRVAAAELGDVEARVAAGKKALAEAEAARDEAEARAKSAEARAQVAEQEFARIRAAAAKLVGG